LGVRKEEFFKLVFDLSDEDERGLNLCFCLADFLPDSVELCSRLFEPFDTVGEVVQGDLASRCPLGRWL